MTMKKFFKVPGFQKHMKKLDDRRNEDFLEGRFVSLDLLKICNLKLNPSSYPASIK